METKGDYWYCWGLLNLRMCFIPGDWQCESEITQDLAAKLVDGISTQWRVSTISPAKKRIIDGYGSKAMMMMIIIIITIIIFFSDIIIKKYYHYLLLLLLLLSLLFTV